MKQFVFLFSIFFISCTAVLANKNDSLKQYTGKFKFPEGSIITEATITFEDGVLNVSSTAGSSTLEKTGEDEFLITGFNGTAVFKRNESKKIIGVHIEAMGYVLDGTKDESSSNSKIQKTDKIPEPVPIIPIIGQE